MAQQTLNNGESGLVIRGKINDNFSELYGDLAGLGSAAQADTGDFDAAGAAAAVPPGTAVDTGWSANASAGDPGAFVADWVASGHDPAGSDTVSVATLGAVVNQLETLTKKVQALQATGFANKRPNVA